VSGVGYKERRTQEPEIEICGLVIASALENVAIENTCSRYKKIFVGDSN
jgi:hypothetical protein